MDENLLNSWPRTFPEALTLQAELRHRVKQIPLPGPLRLVGGADAICDREDRRIFGAVAVFTYPDLELVEEVWEAGAVPFPYRTGLLSFREIPVLAAAFRKLQNLPDVLLVDGQGIAHPRGLGLASHLGLVLEVPTVGMAKSRLVGAGPEPGLEAGSASPLTWQGKVVGLILRTISGRKPLYLSPGHLITLNECREIGLGCVRKYRIPLPLREADHLTRRLKAAGLDPPGESAGTRPGKPR
jgi:deoxyribonuclease V